MRYTIQSNPERNTKTCVHIDSDFKVLINNLSYLLRSLRKIEIPIWFTPMPKDGLRRTKVKERYSANCRKRNKNHIVGTFSVINTDYQL